MNKNLFVIVLCIFIALFLVACGNEAVQTVEVTRIVPQTVVATQIVEVTVEALQNTPATETADQLCTCIQDTAYYDGIVVITQYHTLFGNALYEEAYQLLSPSKQRYPSLEEYIEKAELVQIQESRVVFIQPYYEWAQQQGYRPFEDPADKKTFYARIYREGKNGWAGAAPNGTHTYFITVALENGEWKMYETNTSPPLR